MELKNVVPWGRSLAEYRLMFALTDGDLKKSILGCGDGPAGFNAELSGQGGRVVSADPVYAFDSDAIRARIDEVYPEIMAQVNQHLDDYIWSTIPDAESLGRIRMAAMEQFLEDFDAGRQSGRYVCAALPSLPFADDQFELALCSHYLFLYSDHVNAQQHIEGMLELCRVAAEVRVFPLMSLEGKLSPHLDPVRKALEQKGVTTSLQPVSYQFQKGASEMLVARRG